MQVAKFWRRNQLRYRLQGLAQSKAQLTAEVNPVAVDNKSAEKSFDSNVKVKVA